MNTRTKIFFLVFFVVIALSVAASYFRYAVFNDYLIEAEAECDPYTEACFVHVCDPITDGDCTGDPQEDTSYYEIVRRNAKNIPACDPSSDGCQALVCPDGEEGCEVILCDSDSVFDRDATCNDPAAYSDQNPPEDSEGTSVGDETADMEGGDIENETIEGAGSAEHQEEGSNSGSDGISGDAEAKGDSESEAEL